MRFATVALAVFGAAASVSASLVARQSPYPACADPCVTGANTGSCASTDLKCLCTNNDFITSTTTCIQSKCTGDDLTKAQTVATGLCASVGVTLTPPASTGSATGSATGTASGSASASSATSPSGSSTATGSSTGSPSSSPTSGASTNGVAMIGVAAAAIAAFAL